MALCNGHNNNGELCVGCRHWPDRSKCLLLASVQWSQSLQITHWQALRWTIWPCVCLSYFSCKHGKWKRAAAPLAIDLFRHQLEWHRLCGFCIRAVQAPLWYGHDALAVRRHRATLTCYTGARARCSRQRRIRKSLPQSGSLQHFPILISCRTVAQRHGLRHAQCSPFVGWCDALARATT